VRRLIIFLIALIAIALAWRFTPLRAWLEPRRILAAAEAVRQLPLPFLIVPSVYVLLGLVLFPVNVLKLATLVVYGPLFGFLYALLGTLLSAAVGHTIGRRVGKQAIERWTGPRIDAIKLRVRASGMWAVAGLRMVPLGPFTLVNAMFGAAGVRLRDFVIGTFIGTVPPLCVMAFLGRSIERLLQHWAS
jgi:phospholipase D1/2